MSYYHLSKEKNMMGQIVVPLDFNIFLATRRCDVSIFINSKRAAFYILDTCLEETLKIFCYVRNLPQR